MHVMLSTIRNHGEGIQKILEMVQRRNTRSEELQWKTEENFEELMKEDFSVKERTGTEKAKIKYRMIWLIESMRYDKSPEKIMKEIIETVLGMIAASNKFTKKGKAAKELYKEYLTSGSEGYNTDNRGGSEKVEKDMSEESGKPEI